MSNMPPGIETRPSPLTSSHSASTVKRAFSLPIAPYHTPSQQTGRTEPSGPTIQDDQDGQEELNRQNWQHWQYEHNGSLVGAGSLPISNHFSAGNGKTSKVIERLTAENDRLRRELNAEKAAKEESLQAQRVLKNVVNQLEDKNNTLNHQFETHDGALARKERRMDDLKVLLEQEVHRRKSAEDREADMSSKLDETTADVAKQLAFYKNAAKFSETAYSTISRDYISLRSRVDSIQQSWEDYTLAVEDKSKERETMLTRLEVLLDQKRQAVEQADRVNREQAALLDQYRLDFKDIARCKQEMITTAHEMRWLMGLHKSRSS